MGESRKNPLETLGLTPEIAARLGEQDLFTLVKSMYRSLQKVFHPDRSRTRNPKEAARAAEQAVELNLAFEKLNLDKDADSFRRHQKAYAARRGRGLSRRLGQLQNEIRKKDQEQSDLADGFMIYLLQSLPWYSENGETARTHLTPANVRLGLNDVAINQNVRTMSWTLGSNYKEIIFDALGALYYRPVGRAQPFPANYIHLLGTIEAKELDLVPILDRVPPKPGFFRVPALNKRYGIDGAPLQVLNTLSLPKFKKHCLPRLRPELKERAYLFSIHRPLFEAEGSISVEGIIVKISKP
ncbi:MAG: J domain-containing protein [Thermodesulfobacteriota bacterium]